MPRPKRLPTCPLPVRHMGRRGAGLVPCAWHYAWMLDSADDRRSRVLIAWAGLAKVDRLERFQVIVRARSALCPAGWVGILRLEDTVTVVVPHDDLVGAVRSALADVPAALMDVTTRLRGVAEVLGPAMLFFAVDTLPPAPEYHVYPAVPGDVDNLLAASTPDEAKESGLLGVTSAVFVTKTDNGSITAACGFSHWPQNIAHLCVLAHPDHRREGAGRAVANRAISDALEQDLLPQWRARPEASKSMARSLGLTELGEQLSLRIGDDH